MREGGKTVAKVPTLLIVKEPDYPRVTSIDVQDGTTQGTYQIETYLPAGAEELAFLVYDSNLDFVKAGIYKSRIKAINISTGTAKSMVTPHCRQENIICLLCREQREIKPGAD